MHKPVASDSPSKDLRRNSFPLDTQIGSYSLTIPKDSVDTRKRIGYLAQAPRFYGHMTARETLRFKAHFYYRGPAPEIEKRITETLELVGLS
jgi:ABC-2 type transport system ATP-binding protein